MMNENSDSLDAVAVYCASSVGKHPAFRQAAISLGTALARTERPLVYGGGSKGIMGIVSSTVIKEGGKATGVIPYAMHTAGGEKEQMTCEDPQGKNLNGDAEAINEQVETIVVNSMHERKIEMAKRVGGFVGLPGGFGTFEEVFEVITWTQIGIHNKPVVLLNVLSFFDPLRQLIRNGVENGFIQPRNEHICVFVDGPADLSEHEAFDWGSAATKALDSWTRDPSASGAFTYDWSKRIGTNGETHADKLENA